MVSPANPQLSGGIPRAPPSPIKLVHDGNEENEMRAPHYPWPERQATVRRLPNACSRPGTSPARPGTPALRKLLRPAAFQLLPPAAASDERTPRRDAKPLTNTRLRLFWNQALALCVCVVTEGDGV